MKAKVQTPTLKESTIVERVARVVSSVRGTKPDYTQLATELEPAIPFDVFGVVLLRHDHQAVRVTACQRVGGEWIVHHHQHPFEDSMVERVMRNPVMQIRNFPEGIDGPPAECGDALSGCHQLRAVFIAPLIVGERVLGTLELGSVVPDTYADDTLLRLIAAVTRVLAAAIESAQMGGSAEIQDRQRQALKDVSSALTSKMDLSTILNQIVNGIAKALNVASTIVTFDQHEGTLRLAAQSGLEVVKLRAIVARKTAITEQSIIGYTLRRRQPCVSQDISTDERFPASRIFATKLAIRSIFSYPLVTGTTVFGALLLCSVEPGGFTPLKSDILSLFASQATIAIHNGMLIEAAHQRSRFQQAIEQLERAYEQNLDEREILARVRRESEQTFGISFRSLLHFIGDHLLTRSERDLHAMLQGSQQEEAESDTVSLLLTGRQTLTEIESKEDRAVHEVLTEKMGGASSSVRASHAESVVLLTQTADTALARAAVLSELGRLFSQLKQGTGYIKDAWFVVDLNGMCIYMNPAAEVFCGLHIGVVTESTLEDIFAELLPRMRNSEEVQAYLHDFTLGNVYRKDLRCVLAAEVVDGRAEVSESQARSTLHVDGAASDQHYRLARYPLFNQQGTLLANVLQVHDVTEQVRDEKNKTALLSSVSHELRTPLTTIKAAVTGLLQVDVQWDEQVRREILEEINAEADHLGVLVNALVEMSRIEMGALVLDKQWCDIVEVVHGALIRLERTLAGRRVRTSFQPRLPLIYADHVQLERVFYHLIEHTASHNPGNADILIAVDMVEKQSDETLPGYLRVKVIDHGYEMQVNERERIFKTFNGLNVRGSGLGLAIARGIIEAHQGYIEVEAVAGEDGSSFVFTLPVQAYDTMLAPTMTGSSSVRSKGQETGSVQLEPTDVHPLSMKAQFIASTSEEQ